MSSSTKLPEIQASTRQEIGVMVGFMAIFALVLLSFSVGWRIQNQRQEVVEERRQQELKEGGWGLKEGKGGVVHQEAVREGAKVMGEKV